MILNIIIVVYKILLFAVRVYSTIWFIWIILSWLNTFGVVRTNYYNPIIRLLENMTDGVIDRIFSLFPVNYRYKFVVGNLDLAPLVFLLVLTYFLPFLLSRLVSIFIRILS